MVRKVGGTRKKAKGKVSGVRKHTTKRRKRRISGFSGFGDIGGALQKIAALGAGSFVAREINNIGIKSFSATTFTPMVSGIAQVVAGFFLPKFVKSPFVQNMGDGMMAAGVLVIAIDAKMITGVSNRMTYPISGVSNLRVINGAVNGVSNLRVVNGPQTRVSNVPTLRPVAQATVVRRGVAFPNNS